MVNIVKCLLIGVAIVYAAMVSAGDEVCGSVGALFEVVACLQAQLQAEDKKLNEVYQNKRKRLPAKKFSALQAAQLKWIAYRDANCSFHRINAEVEADDNGNQLHQGSLAQASCLVNMTKARTNELASDVF